MTQMTIEEAQSKLKAIIEALNPGESVQIVQDQRPVAILVRENELPATRRKAGNCAGMIQVVSDDDEHLADFADYMPS